LAWERVLSFSGLVEYRSYRNAIGMTGQGLGLESQPKFLGVRDEAVNFKE
jgi:hypothetical protein